jgi:hypothetical protein
MVEKGLWKRADLDAVAAYMGNAPNVPHLSAGELIGVGIRSRPVPDEGLARRYPTWSPAQLESITKCNNFYFRAIDALARGIARRIALDSPAELATFLSLTARHEWSCSGHARMIPDADRERHWISILQAVAANDFAVAQRFAESALHAPVRKPTVKEYAVLTAGILALLLRDDAELKKAVEAAERCKPKAYVVAMFETLRGVVNQSPEAVATGLTKVLKAFPKFMMNDSIMRLIDPHAHGLFRLCHRRSAELTSAFDVDRGSPWDPGLHAWWETDSDPLSGIDLTSTDAELQQVLIRLERPVWWDAEESAAW